MCVCVWGGGGGAASSSLLPTTQSYALSYDQLQLAQWHYNNEVFLLRKVLSGDTVLSMDLYMYIYYIGPWF